MQPANSEKQQIARNSLRYLSATVVGQFVGILRSVFIPILLSPSQLGVWNFMTVIISYGGNSHLGFLHGMNNIIPMLRGEGETKKIEETADSVFWTTLALNFFWALVLFVASYLIAGDYSIAMRITSFLIFVMGMFAYYFSLLRANNNFQLISKGVGLVSTLATALILAFAWLSADKLRGALLGMSLAYTAVLLYWAVASKYRFNLRVSARALRNTFAVGVPIISVCLIDSIFLSVDRWIIASYVGATALGYYALAIMVNNLIAMIPGSVSSVLHSKMLERYGQSKRTTDLKGIYVGPALVVAGVVCVVIGAATLALPPIINYILPKYSNSLPLFGILLPAAYFHSASSLSGTLLLAISKQRAMVLIQLSALLFAITLGCLSVARQLGVIGVAWSTAGAYALYGFGYMAAAAYYVFSRPLDIAVFLGKVYGLFAAMLIALFFVQTLFPVGETFTLAVVYSALKFLCYLLFMAVVFWRLNRDSGLFGVIQQAFPSLSRLLKRRGTAIAISGAEVS